MRYHNNQRRGSRGSGQRRGGRRFNDSRRGGNRDDAPRRFRRGSRDFNNRRPNRDSGRDNAQGAQGRRTGDRVRRRISRVSRDNNGKRRISRDNKNKDFKKENRDLDGELMNYWVKGGKRNDEEGKNLAQQKLNQQMQNYWKQRNQAGQKKQQKASN